MSKFTGSLDARTEARRERALLVGLYASDSATPPEEMLVELARLVAAAGVQVVGSAGHCLRSRRDLCAATYTNAGKSSLMNALTAAGTYTADQLFDTVDSKTRRWQVEPGLPAMISDTVGFVRDLPHALVASFRSTLEEASRRTYCSTSSMPAIHEPPPKSTPFEKCSPISVAIALSSTRVHLGPSERSGGRGQGGIARPRALSHSNRALRRRPMDRGNPRGARRTGPVPTRVSRSCPRAAGAMSGED